LRFCSGQRAAPFETNAGYCSQPTSQLTDLLGRAYELGAKTFLTKPCTQEDLGNLMNAYQGYWALAASNDTATSTNRDF